MKMTVSLIALAAVLAQPASAITFPSLTTIYVGTGVRDGGGANNTGIATVFHCSNVSGVSATVRFLVLNAGGAFQASVTIVFPHGVTQTVSTNFTSPYIETDELATGVVNQGVVNIESTESGVFCSAETIDAAAATPIGVTRPLVRVNPHPGTVE
jgi:hypothetical protein